MHNAHSPSTTQYAVDTWKLAHRLVLDLYKISAAFPAEEQQGLTRMVRAGAVAVASSIVSGHTRKDSKDFSQRVSDAAAALEETKYALLVARDLGYLAEPTYDRLMPDAEAVSEQLAELRKRLSEGEDASALPEREAAPGPAAPEAVSATDEYPTLAAPGKRTFANTKSVGSAVKDLWGWLRGAPGRASSKDEELAGRVWTEDAVGTPNYLDQQPDEELTPRS